MHKRLTHPYLREELYRDGTPMIMKKSSVSKLPPLATAKPAWTERAEMEVPVQIVVDMDQGAALGQSAMSLEAEASMSAALEDALSTIVLTDPLENDLPDPLEMQPPDATPTDTVASWWPPDTTPAGTVAEAMAAPPGPTEGEIIVSASIKLLNDMKDQQAANAARFNTQADRYSHSLQTLDQELEEHQKHLADAEKGKENFGAWAEDSNAPGDGGDVFRGGKPKVGRCRLTPGWTRVDPRLTAPGVSA
jgi:hypothetical protein